LPNVPPGSNYTVSASHSGYGTQTISGVPVSSGATTTESFALVATPPGGISGQVTDAQTSSAVQGATVACSCQAATVTTATDGSYSFVGVAPGGYTMSVSAPGYVSPSPAGVSVSPGQTSTQNFALSVAVHQPIFSDGFESGNVSAWTSSSAMTVESNFVHSGTAAAQASVSLTAGYAKKTLPSTYSDAYGRVWFNIQSQSTPASVLRFKTAANSGVAFLLVQPNGQLALNVNGTKVATSATIVSRAVFHELELHTTISGTSLTSQVWLDGTAVNDLAGTFSLGTSGITSVGVFQIGEASPTQTYNIVFDDAAFDSQYIP
jgi:hypothetical protein